MFSEKYRHLVYQLAENINLVLMESKEASKLDGWSRGPVFRDGNMFDISWTLREEDLEVYIKTVKRISSSNSPKFYKEPQWVGYWSFIVKDPMGYTLDLYYEYSNKPDTDPLWQELINS